MALGGSMPKEEWGTKRICPDTGKRFYDLNNNPVISPYTGKEVILDKRAYLGINTDFSLIIKEQSEK